MIRDKGVSGKPSPNGKADDHLATSPSANGNGKAHANGKAKPNDHLTLEESAHGATDRASDAQTVAHRHAE